MAGFIATPTPSLHSVVNYSPPLCYVELTEERASDLYPSPSLSKVLGHFISEPEHKPSA